jgi:ubiquinone/menaquinone biosynthesis C-methylase UbiE
MSWSYDFVAAAVSIGRWKDWVMTVLPYLEGPRVLELGHGPGHLQVALRGKGISTVGLDASRQMGQQARQRILKQSQYPQLTCGYAQNLPFTDHFFDQVVATFPTEYLYASATLTGIHRVLKTGGTLVVLPVAWITGRSILDRGTAALFRVTRQAPDFTTQPGWESDWLEPFIQAGFHTRAELHTRKSWSVFIIFARKVRENSILA